MPPEQAGLFSIGVGMVGGLALFLYGMGQMAESLQLVAGERLKSILARLTRNRVTGVFTGAFVTSVIQSSSITTVLVVGFISAGLMTLSQSVGVILGADIGTTLTVQIIAFNIEEYSLILVAAGFFVMFLGRRREKAGLYGAAVLGLGLVFLGMGIMRDATAPLRTYRLFLDAMAGLDKPVIAILAGALFTALVQASAATIGVIIVLGSQGMLSLPAAIALLFGANIGTTVTALLASIGRTRDARRSAVIHLLFKVLGVVLWVFFIDQLAWLVTQVSPVHPELAGTDRVAAELPRQIANAHTLFNVANTLVFLPLGGVFVWLTGKLLPERPAEAETGVRVRYLDDSLMGTPALALDRARLELLHLGDRVRAMLDASLPATLDGDLKELAAVRGMDEGVDFLHGEILTYLGRVSQLPLSVDLTAELMGLMEAANDLENIGDVVETNLVSLGESRIEDMVYVSDATRAVITGFHAAVARALDLSLQAVTGRSEAAAREVVAMKGEINRLYDEAARHEARRLVAAEPARLPHYTFEVDVIESLKRVYYFCKRMARAALPSVNLSTGP